MDELERIEKAVVRGEQMPLGLNVFDQIMFHGLSFINKNYQTKVIDKQTASAYKRSLDREVEALKAEYAFALKCYDTAADRYKGTERAVESFLKDKTIDNALEIVNALHGLNLTADGKED